MATYFTVDRLGTLIEGQVIQLQRHGDITPPELQAHVDELFPDGVSAHGEAYFLRNRSDNVSGPDIELQFEYVRRAMYPAQPSRLQSMFGVRSIAEAQAMRVTLNAPLAAIWELRCEDGLKVDMGLLVGNVNTILVRSYLAGLYWKGEPHPAQPPLWEMLLRLPVHVVRRVPESCETLLT